MKQIMTHIVAGYPSLEENYKVMKTMVESGVSMIEIQIPFSDPIADGPTILKANQDALDNGTKLKDCFELAKKITSEVDIPVLFMTYTNIPYSYGLEKFIIDSKKVGISGFIIPDLPYDDKALNYINLANKHGLNAVQVISPDISEKRLSEICSVASGTIYTTLKVGITGAMEETNRDGLNFIDTIKKHTDTQIAAGFGISSPEQVKEVNDKGAIAVIGSHLINTYNASGINGIKEFLNQI